jgi:uncharacterized protein (DUF302 family)
MGTKLSHLSSLVTLIGLSMVPASGAGDRAPKAAITVASVTHLNFKSPKPFAAVCASIEQQLGRFDSNALTTLLSNSASPAAIEARIHAMEGSSGLMLFVVRDHGQLLTLEGKKAYARQYEVGNPLTARQMTKVDLRAGEYAPLRMLVYLGVDHMTHVDYDLPSSVFGRLKSSDIDTVATGLNRKLEMLVTNALKN